MRDPEMSPDENSSPLARALWRVGPVLAGLVTTVVLSVATDAFMHASGVFPPLGQPMADGLFLLALAYRVGFGVAGGFVTGRLARRRPMRHVAVLATIGLVLSALGAIATWGAGPEFGPKWYALAVVATAFPTAWWGGLLANRR
ncbi:hypothetical protein [Nannocystis bainbridge]|uniref:Major facilitator superfamily (MFS) profile domain-containing protein n=1 Tax=Nannocystis bainbridge TaxID=2995303 RepID=A0ABT5EBL5_9BACT|nr:hypothetical protein [Nannocystis bainbridge]MDC0722252.1 hypothetical protein [Nannocystis bainbridge]